MDRELAEKTMIVALQSSALLNQYLEILQENLEPEEFKQYTRKVGKVMGETLIEILNPIWKEYPELLPVEMDGKYKKSEKYAKQTHEFLKKLLNDSAL